MNRAAQFLVVRMWYTLLILTGKRSKLPFRFRHTPHPLAKAPAADIGLDILK